MIERDRAVADILQLDIFAPTRDRVIHDLADDDGPDTRPGIGRPRGHIGLCRHVFRADTVEVASKGHAIFRGVEFHLVDKGEQVGSSIRLDQVELIPLGTQAELRGRGYAGARVPFAVGVELGLIEGEIPVAGNDRARRDLEHLVVPRRVAEIPIADIHR